MGGGTLIEGNSHEKIKITSKFSQISPQNVKIWAPVVLQLSSEPNQKYIKYKSGKYNIAALVTADI